MCRRCPRTEAARFAIAPSASPATLGCVAPSEPLSVRLSYFASRAAEGELASAEGNFEKQRVDGGHYRGEESGHH